MSFAILGCIIETANSGIVPHCLSILDTLGYCCVRPLIIEHYNSFIAAIQMQSTFGKDKAAGYWYSTERWWLFMWVRYLSLCGSTETTWLLKLLKLKREIRHVQKTSTCLPRPACWISQCLGAKTKASLRTPRVTESHYFAHWQFFAHVMSLVFCKINR